MPMSVTAAWHRTLREPHQLPYAIQCLQCLIQ